MKKRVCFLALLMVAQLAGAQGLYENFANPPQEARPRVWWHWMDGNVSIDGITKDIDWMERAGIGGFHHYAMNLAAEKGMETAVASAPGWSSTGGPWVKPADAMKKLTWRTKEVTGGTVQLIRLPAHFDTPGTYQNIADGGQTEHWFQHVATLAVKLPDAERSMQEMGARVTSSGGSLDPVFLRSAAADPRPDPLRRKGPQCLAQ